MTEALEDSYEVVREAYRQLREKYARALVSNDPNAVKYCDEAALVWARLRAFDGEEEASLDSEMHIVLSFSEAVGASNQAEAKRLYQAMSESYRSAIDVAESIRPGLMKIWL